MEEMNNKNVAEVKPLAVNERIDMNKVAQDLASINDLRGDIRDITERLLSLYAEDDKDYYETTIEDHINGLGKIVGELCECILSQAAMQYEKRQ